MYADIILTSSNIFTGLNNQVINGSIAIKNNKIIYVGNKNIQEYINDTTQIIDVKDKLIIPGLHDSHIHFMLSAILHSGKVTSLFTALSKQDCLDTLLTFAQTAAYDPKEWLIALGWSHLVWQEPIMPNKDILDQLFPDTPVFILSMDAHTAWVNSKGLEKLGIHPNSVDPDGGSYERDQNNQLTGILYETACLGNIANVFNFADDIMQDMACKFMQFANSYGITAVSDLSIMPLPGTDLILDEVYHQLELKDLSSLRIHMFPALTDDLTRPLQLKEKYTSSMLQFSGTKQFFDGVSSTHTAYLKQPYANANSADDKGCLNMPIEKMQELIFSAIENNMSTRTHTIGDAAISELLAILKTAKTKYPDKNNLQHVLEHLEYIDDQEIDLLHELNVIASVQPSHAFMDMDITENDFGTDRLEGMWPFNSYLARGVTVSFGSDSPVTEINPFANIYYAAERHDFTSTTAKYFQPQEKISIAEAIRAYTLGSYQAVNRQHELGSITKGKLADIAVLDTNILSVDPLNIIDTKALITIVNGKIVHQQQF